MALPFATSPAAATAPFRLLTIQHEPTGGDLARRLWTSLGSRARRADAVEEADSAIVGAIRGRARGGRGQPSSAASALRSGVPRMFVHSLAAGWEFYGAEHRAAPEAVRSAIAATESMAMRDADYEHAVAMVNGAQAARAAGEARPGKRHRPP